MSSDSNFSLTEAEIVYELSSLFHAAILDILGYGIYTSVYFGTLYLTLSRGHNRPRVGSPVLTTVMWILVTIHVSITWASLDIVVIQHGETRETQFNALLWFTFEEFRLQHVVDVAVTHGSLLLADAVMIWRCWVLYSKRWFIVVIPVLCIAIGAVCNIWRTISIYSKSPGWGTDQDNTLELIFLSTTVLTNMFCTTAIVGRIVDVVGWKKLLKTYHSLMEILIESSLLYTSIFILRIGLAIYTQYFTSEPDERSLYAKSLSYSITGIAPTLIIGYVAAGFSKPDDSWASGDMGSTTMRSFVESLRFARPATSGVTEAVDLERSIRSEEEAECPGTREYENHSRSIQTTSDEGKNLKKGYLFFLGWCR